jgi:hypothetical protein
MTFRATALPLLKRVQMAVRAGSGKVAQIGVDALLLHSPREYLLFDRLPYLRRIYLTVAPHSAERPTRCFGPNRRVTPRIR